MESFGLQGAGLLPDIPGVYFDVIWLAAGLLVAVIVLALVRDGRLTRLGLTSGAVGVAIVVLCVSALPRLWDDARYLNAHRRAYQARSADEARERCMQDGGVSGALGFIRWLRDELPDDARYRVQGGFDAACLSFNLMPSRLARDPKTADWVIFFGAIPPSWQRRIERRDPSIRVYEPGLALGRVS
jgi:hypothetical protein